MELTENLSAKFIQRSEHRATSVVLAWGNNCQATHRYVTYLRSSQEEADTKMMLHAVDNASTGTTQVNSYSPDTDVCSGKSNLKIGHENHPKSVTFLFWIRT